MKKKDIFKDKSKEEKDMNTVVERYCSVAESLEESLKQMKLMREGKLPKKTWDEMRVERKAKRDKYKNEV
jgi:hypothetical protein